MVRLKKWLAALSKLCDVSHPALVLNELIVQSVDMMLKLAQFIRVTLPNKASTKDANERLSIVVIVVALRMVVTPNLLL